MKYTQHLWRLVVALGLGMSAVMVGLSGASPTATAHGSVDNPPSRVYACRFLNRNNPACAAAWRANPQALYDWMEVNIGDVGSQHRARIPDGQLCGAGRDKYAAFNAARSDWPVTNVVPGADGKYHFSYEATAGHATRFFKFYLTKQGFNPNNPLRWDDLEEVHNSGGSGARSRYEFAVDLPARTGQHILFQIWERSDSTEAFYSCSDITINNPGGGPGPVTTVPPTTAPPKPAPPKPVPPKPAPPRPKCPDPKPVDVDAIDAAAVATVLCPAKRLGRN